VIRVAMNGGANTVAIDIHRVRLAFMRIIVAGRCSLRPKPAVAFTDGLKRLTQSTAIRLQENKYIYWPRWITGKSESCRRRRAATRDQSSGAIVTRRPSNASDTLI
jgi:hypothetical protein